MKLIPESHATEDKNAIYRRVYKAFTTSSNLPDNKNNTGPTLRLVHKAFTTPSHWTDNKNNKKPNLVLIHKALKTMLIAAYYDIEELRALEDTLEGTEAWYRDIIHWNLSENTFPKYQVDKLTGEVEHKFSKAIPPLHKTIRFKGYPDEVPIRIEIKNFSTKAVYYDIARGLMATIGFPFIILNENAIILRSKDRATAIAVIKWARMQSKSRIPIAFKY